MITIRCAKPEDAETLSQIAIAAKGHWNYPNHWMELWTPQLTFGPAYFEQNETWVAESDGMVVAFFTLQDRNGKSWIEDILVLPAHMGRGIGNQLFQHAVGVARQRKYQTLQLESDPHAVGFYERMGLRKIGERQYELDGQPRILPLMEMTL